MIRKKDDVVGALFHDVAHLLRLRIDLELRECALQYLNGSERPGLQCASQKIKARLTEGSSQAA